MIDDLQRSGYNGANDAKKALQKRGWLDRIWSTASQTDSYQRLPSFPKDPPGLRYMARKWNLVEQTNDNAVGDILDYVEQVTAEPNKDIVQFSRYLDEIRGKYPGLSRGVEDLAYQSDILGQRKKLLADLLRKLQSRARSIEGGRRPKEIELIPSDMTILHYLWINPASHPGLFKVPSEFETVSRKLSLPGSVEHRMPQPQLTVAQRTDIQHLLEQVIQATDINTYKALNPRDSHAAAARVFDYLADDPIGARRRAMYRVLTHKAEYGQPFDSDELGLIHRTLGLTPGNPASSANRVLKKRGWLDAL